MYEWVRFVFFAAWLDRVEFLFLSFLSFRGQRCDAFLPIKNVTLSDKSILPFSNLGEKGRFQRSLKCGKLAKPFHFITFSDRFNTPFHYVSFQYPFQLILCWLFLFKGGKILSSAYTLSWRRFRSAEVPASVLFWFRAKSVCVALAIGERRDSIAVSACINSLADTYNNFFPSLLD